MMYLASFCVALLVASRSAAACEVGIGVDAVLSLRNVQYRAAVRCVDKNSVVLTFPGDLDFMFVIFEGGGDRRLSRLSLVSFNREVAFRSGVRETFQELNLPKGAITQFLYRVDAQGDTSTEAIGTLFVGVRAPESLQSNLKGRL